MLEFVREASAPQQGTEEQLFRRMDDKQAFQARYYWLKQKYPGREQNDLLKDSLRWQYVVKLNGYDSKARREWEEAPLKRGDIEALLARCAQSGSFSEAVRLVGALFSNPDKLGKCFPIPLHENDFKSDEFSNLSSFDWRESDRTVQMLLDASPAVQNAMSYAIRALRGQLAMSGGNISRHDGRLRAMRIAMILERVPDNTRAQFVRDSLATASKELVVLLTSFLIETWGMVRAVSWINSVVSEAVDVGKGAFSFDYVQSLMSMMRFAYEINKTLPLQSQVPAQMFVNEAIARHAAADPDFLDRDFFIWYSSTKEGPSRSFVQCPFVLDTASKAHILQVDSEIEHRQKFHEAAGGGEIPFLIIRVRREYLVQDTMSLLARVPKSDLRKPLKVQFVGEEGVDAGGVRKEYFLLMLRQLLDPGFGMFRECDPKTKLLWFNPDSLEAILQFELVGVLIGLAITNRVIVDIPFPRILYKLLAADASTLSASLTDLAELDPSLASGLDALLKFTGDVQSVFCRTFEASRESWGVVQNVDLVRNGSMIPVDNSNRDEYVRLYVNWYLIESVRSQFTSFRQGFFSVMNESMLRNLLISAEELELMVVGVRTLDFTALEEAARYDDGYDADSNTVKVFWKVAHALSDDEKRTLLRFITGSDRVPIRGLGDVRIVISRAGSDSELLPSSHTCFDHLLLPDYGSDEEKMRTKLKLALEHAEGFFTR